MGRENVFKKALIVVLLFKMDFIMHYLLPNDCTLCEVLCMQFGYRMYVLFI